LAQFPELPGGPTGATTALARFKGQTTQQVVAGLYQFRAPFQQRGTFWVRLGTPIKQAAPLTFSLFGKQDAGLDVPPFRVLGYCSNADGTPLGRPLTAHYHPPVGGDVSASPMEWLQLLDGMTGLASPQWVRWQVPAGTANIEIRIQPSGWQEAPDTRLVGYLGGLRLQLD
jgi:hypothetical protein